MARQGDAGPCGSVTRKNRYSANVCHAIERHFVTLRINSSSHMFYMNSFRWFTFKKKINGFVLVYIGSKAGKTGFVKVRPRSKLPWWSGN